MTEMPNPAAGRREEPFRPMIFVGLGSTGAKIVSRLRRKIDANADQLPRQFYKYILLTSEQESEPGVDQNLLHHSFAGAGGAVALSGPDAVTALLSTDDDELSADFDAWWHRDVYDEDRAWVPPLRDLTTGAGGMRSVGRLLLHYSQLDNDSDIVAAFAALREAIIRQRNELDPVDAAKVQINRIPVYVFGLTAGGTCSGTMFDLPLLVQKAIPESTIFGVFLLGDICYRGASIAEKDSSKARTQKLNTLYALAEMTMLQDNRARALLRKEWPTRIGMHNIEGQLLTAPYFRVTLVGAKNESGVALDDFQQYQELIADYYGGLFSSEAHARTFARQVDEEAEQNIAGKPGDSFERIGRLELTLPREKALLLAKERIALALATQTFKNASEDRLLSAENRFMETIHWGELEQRLGPPASDVSLDPIAPLPDKADVFAAEWEARQTDLESELAPWENCDQGLAAEGQGKFRSAVDLAVAAALEDFFGQQAEKPLTVGTFKSFLTSLVAKVEERASFASSMVTELGVRLFREGGIRQLLVANRQAAVDDFPKSKLTNFLKRRTWSGQDELASRFAEYADLTRALATQRALAKAMGVLLDRLRALQVVRELIGREVAQSVVTDPQTAVEAAFQGRVRGGLRTDVFDGRVEINELLVDPLFATHSAENVSLPDAIVQSIIAGWKCFGNLPYYAGVQKLAEAVSSSSLKTAEAAMRSRDVSQVVAALRTGLSTSFENEMRSRVATRLDEITVWEGLKRYIVAKGAKDPKTVKSLLMSAFKVYGESASFYSTVRADAAGRKGAAARRVYYLCDEAAATAAFTEMGLAPAEAQGLLRELLQKALGLGAAPAAAYRATKDLAIFLSTRGVTPDLLEEFSGVGKLLSKDGGAEDDAQYWTDLRFVSWIKKLRGKDAAGTTLKAKTATGKKILEIKRPRQASKASARAPERGKSPRPRR